MKKLFDYTKKRQIWRILISEEGNILLEERDTKKMEVFYSCLQGSKGKPLWKDKKFFNENYWSGIEAISKNQIFFHRFLKPDMPGHTGIASVDINSGAEQWIREDMTYYYSNSEILIGYDNTNREQAFHSLDFETGKTINTLSKDESERIRNSEDVSIKYRNYKFSKTLYTSNNAELNSRILTILPEEKIAEDTEFIHHNDFLVFSYYVRENNPGMNNYLSIYDLIKNKTVFKERINSASPIPVPDSFFVFKDILLFIKDKQKLTTMELEKH